MSRYIDLEFQVQNLRAQLDSARADLPRARAAERKLEELGYEPTVIQGNTFAGTHYWRLTAEARAEVEKLEAQRRAEAVKLEAQVTSRVRTETLETVIDALNITEYKPWGVQNFWVDLQTALEVRADRAVQRSREEVEARVSNLASRVGAEPAFTYRPNVDATGKIANVNLPDATSKLGKGGQT